MNAFVFIVTIAVSCSVLAQSELAQAPAAQTTNSEIASDRIFPNLKEALQAHTSLKKPNRMIQTGDKNFPQFPSFSECPKTFFRVATVNPKVDGFITADGWKSGWLRRKEELKAVGKGEPPGSFDALPPTAPFEDRIVEYVRVKNKPAAFPKHSSVVGVLENPIRTLSVGYHTGYDNGMKGDHMLLNEIEVGACARYPECQKLQAVDSTEVFKKKGLVPRYSTEGEYALEMHVPKACVVATYRIKFGKVDDKCYSDTQGNCNFGK